MTRSLAGTLVGTMAAAWAVLAPAATAQVGYPPSKSPYHDITTKQELTFYGGQFGGSKGDAGVGPQSGGIFGVRYGIHLGGPAEFAVHVARASTTRDVRDPTKTGAAREVGTASLPLYLMDVGIALNLTGQKSYHWLVPVVGFGLGVVSDMGEHADVGGFKVGTPFALNFGAGIRFVPRGSFGARVEIADYLYQVSYPSAYSTAPSGGTSILPAGAGANQWLHNAVITLGISYRFSR